MHIDRTSKLSRDIIIPTEIFNKYNNSENQFIKDEVFEKAIIGYSFKNDLPWRYEIRLNKNSDHEIMKSIESYVRNYFGHNEKYIYINDNDKKYNDIIIPIDIFNKLEYKMFQTDFYEFIDKVDKFHKVLKGTSFELEQKGCLEIRLNANADISRIRSYIEDYFGDDAKYIKYKQEDDFSS
jgi:hypothetical protein